MYSLSADMSAPIHLLEGKDSQLFNNSCNGLFQSNFNSILTLLKFSYFPKYYTANPLLTIEKAYLVLEIRFINCVMNQVANKAGMAVDVFCEAAVKIGTIVNCSGLAKVFACFRCKNPAVNTV